MIRPAVRIWLYRWREVLVAGAVMLAGLALAATSSGLIHVAGLILAALGAVVLFTAVQRARIQPRSGGPGVVELDEGAVRYLTPGGGLTISLPAVTRIEIETTGDGPGADDLFWIFETPEGVGRIPGSAHGSDLLIDALASFPGASYEQVIAASGSVEPARFAIWAKPRRLLH
ncbi:hypothetical protein [Vannielia sp.]|uniref:hypothetical protein n=1 Tax=Vannielia sp. TaxID=2813045 RepID=UPI0026207941|nr:hypothetical protein [Vannielia sp.]MDF1871091.1 hypothetical protein [Vannielia sp.]